MSHPSERLTHEAWAQYAAELAEWQRQHDEADAARFAPENIAQAPEAQRRHLARTFKWHPRYRTRSYADVNHELRREARAAQVRRRLLVRQPVSTRETDQELAALDALWAPFGGSDWEAVPADNLAGERWEFEAAKDLREDPNYTIERFRRDRARNLPPAARAALRMTGSTLRGIGTVLDAPTRIARAIAHDPEDENPGFLARLFAGMLVRFLTFVLIVLVIGVIVAVVGALT